MKRLVFELLDVVALSRPSLQRVDIGATASAISTYKRSTGYKSYDQVFDHMKSIASGRAEAAQAGYASMPRSAEEVVDMFRRDRG